MMDLGDSGRLGCAVLLAVLLVNALGLSAAANNVPAPAQLKSTTVEAFDHYLRLTDARHNAELQHGASALQVDALAEPQRAEAYRQLKGGQVSIQRLQTREAGETIHCPDGMIHHWVGAVFVPGAFNLKKRFPIAEINDAVCRSCHVIDVRHSQYQGVYTVQLCFRP